MEINDNIFHRQLDILSPEDVFEDVGLIGAGGIGSPTALVLLKMGLPSIKVWDFDTVELHNLPNQLYTKKDVGKKKVDALFINLLDFQFDGQDVEVFDKKWDGTMTEILICTVDSMDMRIELWKQIKENPECNVYIDARMGGELMKIYTINPNDPSHIEFYEKTLYTSEEANELPCTARSIFYNCFVIAGLIGSLVKKHIKGEDVPKEIIFDLKTYGFLKT